VLINAADLPATRLVQPASRITYRFAVAGEDGPVRAFTEWATAEAKRADVRGVRIESLESGRPEMRQTLDRAEKFLNLVALLAALLSAVAVALAARGFAARHLDDCAMLRVLGQSQRTIALAATPSSSPSSAWRQRARRGVGLRRALRVRAMLGGLVEASAAGGGVWPVLFGLGMGLTLLFAFGLPPVLQLAQVPPLRVIRRDVGNLKPPRCGAGHRRGGLRHLAARRQQRPEAGVHRGRRLRRRGAAVRGAQLGGGEAAAARP
jgi:putative ABC transport system permease protein